MNEVIIEIYKDGKWVKAAEFGVYGDNYLAGYRARGRLAYDIDYALSRIQDERIVDRVGFRYPVNFDSYDSKGWPAFLLDIVPTGAARIAWLKLLSLRDDDSSWWQLLRCAAGNPPGNLRIAGAAVDFQKGHPGFDKRDIIDKNVDFVEYAEANGALVAGATDVQGASPKFLLVEDMNNRWHAEGALADGLAKRHWLVKFPRGKKDVDRQILRNEAPYYEVARAFGLRTAASLEYQDDALFILRFDRRLAIAGIERLGLESIASACGISEFGCRISHNDACKAIHRYATEPHKEILEYISRDILNVALRNTDNHGRNTAFLKETSGGIALSPLFDFAPMFLDPEGIARVSRWDAEGEKVIGLPDWGRVAEDVGRETGYGVVALRKWLSDQAEKVKRLPDTMALCGVEVSIIESLVRRIEDTARQLEEARPHY